MIARVPRTLMRCLPVGVVLAALLLPWGSSPSVVAVEQADKGALDEPIDPRRQAMIKKMARQLGRLPVEDATRRSMEDFYLIGTADLNQQTQHADVCFQVLQGQQKVAPFLVEYILDAPEGTLRRWHVFVRFKDSGLAEEALQMARTQYDEAQSYREEIARTYQARTTRRC
ncbi:MAG: hypothetical protein HQ581_24825 [Planctomycetes bacterium]|nr:hypothetical protein [Planctomycetota bacterium]